MRIYFFRTLFAIIQAIMLRGEKKGVLMMS